MSVIILKNLKRRRKKVKENLKKVLPLAVLIFALAAILIFALSKKGNKQVYQEESANMNAEAIASAEIEGPVFMK